jgi:hypothetical protein
MGGGVYPETRTWVKVAKAPSSHKTGATNRFFWVIRWLLRERVAVYGADLFESISEMRGDWF